jgi:hypothetical protein
MGPLHILKLFGSRATGNIEEENGFGSQAIGKDVQSLMLFGYPVIGNREEEVGSGIQDIGSIVDSNEFGVKRWITEILLTVFSPFSELLTPNSELGG